MYWYNRDRMDECQDIKTNKHTFVVRVSFFYTIALRFNAFIQAVWLNNYNNVLSEILSLGRESLASPCENFMSRKIFSADY